MNIFRLHCFCIRAFFALVSISLTVFSAPAQAQYIYVEPSTYLALDSLWTGAGRISSPEIGCQSVADAYTKRAGPPYEGQVQKLTHPDPLFWGCYLDRRYAGGPWYHDQDLDGIIRVQNECPTNYVFNTLVKIDGSTHLRCRGVAGVANEKISLSGLAETRPAGTGGKATVDLTAIVTQGGNPKAGVAVSFSEDVTPNSGGHEHHDVDRPRGRLSGVQGATDANGEVKLIFTAPEVAGIHTVKATCASCSNTSATKEIQVKVPDLIHIPADSQTPSRYVFVGQTSKHPKSHFVTNDSWETLQLVIDTFIALGWGQVGINDASIEWGGMFDIEGKWLQKYMNSNGIWVTGGHAEHRNGEQVDVSFSRPASVSMQLRKNAFHEVCNKNRTSLSPDILWHQTDGYAPHFHLYLTGKAGAPAAGMNNQCTKK